jgi:hypothetical protein
MVRPPRGRTRACVPPIRHAHHRRPVRLRNRRCSESLERTIAQRLGVEVEQRVDLAVVHDVAVGRDLEHHAHSRPLSRMRACSAPEAGHSHVC